MSHVPIRYNKNIIKILHTKKSKLLLLLVVIICLSALLPCLQVSSSCRLHLVAFISVCSLILICLVKTVIVFYNTALLICVIVLHSLYGRMWYLWNIIKYCFLVLLYYEVVWLYVNNGDWMSKDKSERGEMQMGKWVWKASFSPVKLL